MQLNAVGSDTGLAMQKIKKPTPVICTFAWV
jgi:hypothetical protein